MTHTSTTNTVFLKLACQMRYLLRIFWDFTLLLLSQTLYGIRQSSYFLRMLELKGMLDVKLVQVFPNLVTLSIIMTF